MSDSETSGEQHSEGAPTLEDHPGLDNDEATEEGKMMTASGSRGPSVDPDDDPEREARRDGERADPGE